MFMRMSLRMTVKNWMLRPEGALCWDMALKWKHIGFITLKKESNFQSRFSVWWSKECIKGRWWLTKEWRWWPTKEWIRHKNCSTWLLKWRWDFRGTTASQVEVPSLPLRRFTWQRMPLDVYGERVTISETSSDTTSFKNALDRREDKSQ